MSFKARQGAIVGGRAGVGILSRGAMGERFDRVPSRKVKEMMRQAVASEALALSKREACRV